jgi:hypothetical protein
MLIDFSSNLVELLEKQIQNQMNNIIKVRQEAQ